MTNAAVDLCQALASFSDVCSPRVVGHGAHLWHVHEHTNEFFLVLDGQFDIAMRDDDRGERTVSWRAARHLRGAEGHRAQAIFDRRRDLDVRAGRDGHDR